MTELNKENLYDLIEKIKNGSKNKCMILGRKEDIERIEPFICNVDFKIVPDGYLPDSNNVYLLPIENEDCPIKFIVENETLTDFNWLEPEMCKSIMNTKL